MPAKITLKVTQGKLLGQEFVFDERTTCLMGRAADCSPRLPDDVYHTTIGRHHCLLDINPPDIRIRDFGKRGRDSSARQESPLITCRPFCRPPECRLVNVRLIHPHLLPRTDSMAETSQTHLAHNVFFTLTDASPAAQQKLIDGCHQYLKGHPGQVYFSAGTLVPDLARPVNDRAFHVGLHLVFDSRQAHDAYQAHPRHVQFVEQNKPNWASVRVFDTYVS